MERNFWHTEFSDPAYVTLPLFTDSDGFGHAVPGNAREIPYMQFGALNDGRLPCKRKNPYADTIYSAPPLHTSFASMEGGGLGNTSTRPPPLPLIPTRDAHHFPGGSGFGNPTVVNAGASNFPRESRGGGSLFPPLLGSNSSFPPIPMRREAYHLPGSGFGPPPPPSINAGISDFPRENAGCLPTWTLSRSVRSRTSNIHPEPERSSLLPSIQQSQAWPPPPRRLALPTTEQPLDSLPTAPNMNHNNNYYYCPSSAVEQRNFSARYGNEPLLRPMEASLGNNLYEGRSMYFPPPLSSGAPNWLNTSTPMSSASSMDLTQPIGTRNFLLPTPRDLSHIPSSSNTYALSETPEPSMPSSSSSFSLRRSNFGPQDGHSLPSHHPVPGGATSTLGPQTSRTFYTGSFNLSLFPNGAQNDGFPIAPAESFPGALTRGSHAFADAGGRNRQLLSEELTVLNRTLALSGVDIYDRHSALRLDVDNMSYEELLALEERIGNVNTGLTEEAVRRCIRPYRFLSPIGSARESETKCTVCQEDYEEGDELGMLRCSHLYHTDCIKQWLAIKNQCPICKAPSSPDS